MLPDAHFGKIGDKAVDWRNMPDTDTADDDEELPKTPKDVVDILGFDPLEDRKKKINAGGPGSGCHGPNCGRPAGPGHQDTLDREKGTTHGLLRQHGWSKTGPMDLNKRPGTLWVHPQHGTMHVSNNWFVHYGANGDKVGEKTDMAKDKPLVDKLENYMKDKGLIGGGSPPEPPQPAPPPAPPTPPPQPPAPAGQPGAVVPGQYNNADEAHAATLQLENDPALVRAKADLEGYRNTYWGLVTAGSNLSYKIYNLQQKGQDVEADKAELKALQQRRDEAYASKQKAEEHLITLRDGVRQQFYSILRNGEPPSSVQTIAHPKLEQTAANAAKVFSQMIPKSTGDQLKECAFRLNPGKREFYSHTLDTVNVRPKTAMQTNVHEMGHWLEHSVAGMYDAAKQFLDKRTAGETPQRLSKLTGTRGYSKDEIAKPDKFDNPYIGKIYPWKATEVMSMGMENMYKNPAGFAKQDPDHFKFIWNTINRKPHYAD